MEDLTMWLRVVDQWHSDDISGLIETVRNGFNENLKSKTEKVHCDFCSVVPTTSSSECFFRTAEMSGGPSGDERENRSRSNRQPSTSFSIFNWLTCLPIRRRATREGASTTEANTDRSVPETVSSKREDGDEPSTSQVRPMSREHSTLEDDETTENCAGSDGIETPVSSKSSNSSSAPEIPEGPPISKADRKHQLKRSNAYEVNSSASSSDRGSSAGSRRSGPSTTGNQTSSLQPKEDLNNKKEEDDDEGGLGLRGAKSKDYCEEYKSSSSPHHADRFNACSAGYKEESDVDAPNWLDTIRDDIEENDPFYGFGF